MSDSQTRVTKHRPVVEIDIQTGTVKTYAGSIGYEPKAGPNPWRVRFEVKNKFVIPGKSFSSQEAAIIYKKEQSDKLGLTKTRPASLCEMGIDVPESIRQFIAGFIDGDGCVKIVKSGTRVTCHQSSASGVPSVLLEIQRIYGGHIFPPKNIPNHRPSYTLEITEAGYGAYILNDISKYGIIKAHMAQDALAFYQSTDVSLRQHLVKKNLSDHKIENYKQVVINEDRITWHYVAGLFDADGTVGLYNNRPSLQLAQKISPSLLNAILKFSKCAGLANQDVLAINELSSLLTFLAHIADDLIEKADQVYLMIEYLIVSQQYRCKGRIGKIRKENEVTDKRKRLQEINDEVAPMLKQLKRL